MIQPILEARAEIFWRIWEQTNLVRKFTDLKHTLDNALKPIKICQITLCLDITNHMKSEAHISSVVFRFKLDVIIQIPPKEKSFTIFPFIIQLHT